MRILRTTFLLAALTLFLMLVGNYFGGRNGMTIGLGFAILTNAFAYFFSDKTALWSSGAQPVSREQLPRLYAVMERLAAKRAARRRSEEHTSELQSLRHLVCRLLLEKKKKHTRDGNKHLARRLARHQHI